MKICFFTTSYPRFDGDGAGIFVAELAHHLTLRGHEIAVIAPNTITANKVVISGIIVRRFSYWFNTKSSQIAYGSGLTENSKNPWALFQFPFFILAANIALWRQARKADLIHIHWWPNMTILLGVLSLLGKPVVVTAHGTDINLIKSNRLWRIAAKFTLMRADQIIVVAKSFRTDLVELGIDDRNINVIPNGVPDEGNLLAIPLRRTFRGRCMTIGRLIELKNQKLLINAFSTIAKDRPDSTLTIIGDGHLKSELMERATALGLKDRVLFLGQQNRHQINQALAASDIFALTSMNEGLPIVVLEAMAAGLPVVATAVNGVPDLIQNGQNGLLITSGDETGLVNSLEKLFTEPELRRKLSLTARQTVVAKFRWSNLAELTERIYGRAKND